MAVVKHTKSFLPFSAGFDAVTSKPLLVVWVKDDWPKEVFAPNTDTVPTGADPNVLP